MTVSKNEEELHFYAAIGQAFGAWSLVEALMADLFAMAVRSQNRDVASQVYSTVVNWRDKLDILDAALKTDIHDNSLKEDWDKLYERLKRLSRRRNFIAHATIIFSANDQKLYATRQLSKVPPLAFLNSKLEQKHLLNAHRIREIDKAFSLLSKSITNFIDCYSGYIKQQRAPA